MPEKELIRTESKNITLRIDANIVVRWLHYSWKCTLNLRN